MPRITYIQDPVTHKLVPKDEYYSSMDIDAPMVMTDIAPYKSMVDGSIIQGRRQHREHLKQHRMIEIGNETKHHMQSKQPQIDRASIRRDIIEAVKRHSS